MRIPTKHIKTVGVVLALVLALVPFGQDALAQTSSSFPDAIDCGIDVICSTSVAIQYMILGALYGVGKFFGMLLLGFSVLIKWGINYSGTIMTLPTVVAGFDVALSFVNLLFIFAIILIAFKLILGLDEHGSKKMIGHLILAALLVNFSKLIAGVLIDFSNIFTNFFLARFDVASIGGAFEPQKFLDFSGAVIGNGSGYWGDFFSLFPMMLFSTLMTAFAAIILLSVFIMVMYRTIFMAFLLIVMPLIWGCWVIPSFQQYWSEWWDNFMKWIMYLPSVTFFIWLAVSTASLLGTRGGIATGQAPGALGFFENKLGAFAQMLLLGGLLIAGLKAGERSGLMGANLGAKMAGGAGKWAGSRSLKFGKAMGLATIRNPVGVGTGTAALGARTLGGVAGLLRMKGVAAKLKGVADATSKFGGKQAEFAAGQTGDAIKDAVGFKGGEGVIKAVKEFYNVDKQKQNKAAEYQKEKASAYTDDELTARVNEGKGDDTEKYGDLMELKKRNMMGMIPGGQLEVYASAIKNIGAQNTDTANALIATDARLIKTMGRLANKLDADDNVIMDKNGKPEKLSAEDSIDLYMRNMSAGDAKKMRAPAIRALAIKFSTKQAGAIVNEGSQAQVDALKNSLGSTLSGSKADAELNSEIKKGGYVEKLEKNSSALKVAFAQKNKASEYALKKERKQIEKEYAATVAKFGGNIGPDMEKARKLLDYIDQMAQPHSSSGH